MIPGRGILAGCVAPPSDTPDILGRRALPSGRRAPGLMPRSTRSGHEHPARSDPRGGGGMRGRALTISLLVICSVTAVLTQRGTPPPPSPEVLAAIGTRPAVTKAEYEKWKTELSNWGRWGKDDQLGAINLITPAKRKQAASLVKDGVSVSLAGHVNTERAVDNGEPYQHVMTQAGAGRAP